MSTIIVFVYLGLQVKWNQFSSNNSHHTSCIHKGSHAGMWPDLRTSKPDSVSTLQNHWTDHTWRPLEPQVHWDATRTTLADASTQWCSSGDPMFVCIIGTHWKTTGATSTLGCQWCSSGDPVLICIITHWKTTGKPLEDHWKTTGSTLATNIFFSSGIPVYTGVLVPGTLDCHWIATGRPLAQSKGISDTHTPYTKNIYLKI